MTQAHRAAFLVVALLLAAVLVLVVTGPSGSEGASPADPPSTTTPRPDTMRSLSETIAAVWAAATTTTTATPPPPTTTTTHYHPPTTSPPPPVASAPATGDRFDALAQCESGGDPTTNTGNGYYGAFQFALSTWHSIGRSGYPHHHTYGEQKAAAIDLQARSGWGQWSACSAKLGYR